MATRRERAAITRELAARRVEGLWKREFELCGSFWVWLYAERKRRGREPSDEEKCNHPASIALRLLRRVHAAEFGESPAEVAALRP